MFPAGGHLGSDADMLDIILKGTTQGPLSLSLVLIGTVDPEEKIFEFLRRVQC